jgi:hypothetical protein
VTVLLTSRARPERDSTDSTGSRRTSRWEMEEGTAGADKEKLALGLGDQ